VDILRGVGLRRKGREGEGLRNSNIFKRSYNSIRCESARAKVEISYHYSLIISKIGNQLIN
jgi:hypothetical protein